MVTDNKSDNSNHNKNNEYTNNKGDEDMAKMINDKESIKREEREESNVSQLLNQGMKRYDKALEKLSKN